METDASWDAKGVTWDLTKGFANTFCGDIILRILSRRNERPDGIYHVGLLVFGKQYEFGEGGFYIKPVEESSEYYSTVHAPGKSHMTISLGTTQKSAEEFERWIKDMSKKQFSPSKYCMSRNNCAHWAIAACEFLSVRPPTGWSKLCKFTEDKYALQC